MMLKLIGALTMVIVLLGIVTGVIDPIVMFNTVKGIVLSIYEQIAVLIPS